MKAIQRTNIRLYANPQRVLARYLNVGNAVRIAPVADYIRQLSAAAVAEQLATLNQEFGQRHADLTAIFRKNYERLLQYVPPLANADKQVLLGAYFTNEYSIEAAALFNPSIVPHSDQEGVPNGATRFLMSLRAAGEGHISSITFATGLIDAQGNIVLDERSGHLDSGDVTTELVRDKSFVIRRLKHLEAFEKLLEETLPASFNLEEAKQIIGDQKELTLTQQQEIQQALALVFELNYEVAFEEHIPLINRVLFPQSRAETNGIEDARFVTFTEEGKTSYLGTYTAYNGREIRPQLIVTTDFRHYKIGPFYGAAASDKGMALFPEKIAGRYAMIGRQGGRSLSIMYSDDLYFWEEALPLQAPERGWEMLQIGNCGSPVKTDAGWLLLTHGVGPMRKYVLSCSLLDLEHPEKVLASLDLPLLSPNSEEREGYVPNVLYTCGMMAHAGRLIIPYAMSDNAISFATIAEEDLIAELLKNN
ncbi:glycoside hydrolase family 130 protein [Lewinella sp. LCG006]|uniref:glycoside hydrolase family 130 protein n=1 Tax=Lewinella sp. LCG006 TaxID=3231911 RepID=UPI00346073EB